MKNTKTGEENKVKYVVVPNSFQSLLELKTIQQVGLITVNMERFIGKVEATKTLGDLGEVSLTVDPSVKPMIFPVVQKPNGKLRICLDPQPLNSDLQREHYNLPTFDDVLPNLKKSSCFQQTRCTRSFLAYPLG